MSTITIHKTDEVSIRLNQLAKVMNKQREQVIEAALKQYISKQPDQIAGVEQAQTTLEKGAGRDFEVVVKELRNKIQDKQ
ncbi:MAG: CopG family transcriptional regulator [Gammaproteobacteria bacterium]|nr:CopG family transcriptional regulator [Gammaproteobacteria bacterium]